MEVVANEYDEVVRRIYELRGTFIMDKRLKPNTVYLGTSEWYALLNGHDHLVNFSFVKQPTVFGLDIFRVINDNHLSIGHVLKEEDQPWK